MNDKVGRNDPCPCGSGKKFKQCCMSKAPQSAGPPIKFKAKLISQPAAPVQQGPNLMDRTFGDAVAKAEHNPPPKPFKATEK
jgi:hypothetical protein